MERDNWRMMNQLIDSVTLYIMLYNVWYVAIWSALYCCVDVALIQQPYLTTHSLNSYWSVEYNVLYFYFLLLYMWLLATLLYLYIDYKLSYIVVVNACVKPAIQLHISHLNDIALATPSWGSDGMLNQQQANKGFVNQDWQTPSPVSHTRTSAADFMWREWKRWSHGFWMQHANCVVLYKM